MRRRRWVHAVVGVVLAVGGVGCGLAENEEPQAISGDPGILDPDPTTTTSYSVSHVSSIVISPRYLLDCPTSARPASESRTALGGGSTPRAIYAIPSGCKDDMQGKRPAPDGSR